MRFFVQSSNIRKKPHRAAKKLKKCTTAPRCCFLLLFLCCCFLLLLFLAAVSCLCCSSLLLPAAVTLVAAAPRRWSPHWWFPHCCVRQPVSLGPLSGFARRLQSPVEAGSRHADAARGTGSLSESTSSANSALPELCRRPISPSNADFRTSWGRVELDRGWDWNRVGLGWGWNGPG